MSPILISLVLAQPVHALGVVVGKDGAEPSIVRIRSVIAADRPPDDLSRRGVAVVSAQLMVDADDAPWTWLVPLPNGDRSELSRYDSVDFDRIFLATSPAYLPVTRLNYSTPACGGSATPQPPEAGAGCESPGIDSGQASNSPLPLSYYWADPQTTNLDRESSFRVASGEAERVLSELEDEGYDIPDDVHAHLRSHAGQGGDLLVVKMYAPAVGAAGISDVFAWKTTAHAPLLPLGMLQFQPDTNVLFDLHLAGDARWTTDGLSWMEPKIPEAMLLPTDAANPFWQEVLLAGWKQGKLVHIFGGERTALAARMEILDTAIQENPSLYSDLVDSADGVLETFFAVVLFSPVLVFEGLFTPEPREDEVDDLFRNMQIDETLPSGWRRDGKVHMTFQGVLDSTTVEDLGLREDGDLRFREVLMGGGEGQTVVNSAWLSVGLWGLVGLGAAGLRRRTET